MRIINTAVLTIMYLFLLQVSIFDCWGQNDIIRSKVDSLDAVRPSSIKKIKKSGKLFVIYVKKQEHFSSLNNDITAAIKRGEKNIKVKIKKGVFYFNEKHISLHGEMLPDVSISFEGQGTIITSDPSYNSNTGIHYPWCELYKMNDTIKIIDEGEKECFIPYKNSWSYDEFEAFSKVQITQWFRAPVYNVTKIDNDGIYFIAPELKYEKGFANSGYNVNRDFLYKGDIPRFRLYDNRAENKSDASCFLCVDNCVLKSLSFKGLIFANNKPSSPLLIYNNVLTKQILVSRCSFNNIQSGVALFEKTPNIVFDDNTVQNCEGNEIRFINNCPNVRVTHNRFVDCGKGLNNTTCVTCWESDYYIAFNTFRDFGGCAIGVGVWHGFEKKWPSQGIIEYNEMSYTPEYYNNYLQHTLMDCGAIYVWTQNDNVIIRNNYIHDYIGAGDNRGIFCDDGAMNLYIYKNIVLNTPNCYSIDSRSVNDPENKYNCNSNNFMAYNIVDNKVRFMGYSGEERHCVKGYNFVLLDDTGKQLNNKYDYLEFNVEDIPIKGWKRQRGKLLLPHKVKSLTFVVTNNWIRYQ